VSDVHRHQFAVSVFEISTIGKRFSLLQRAYHLLKTSFNFTIFGAFAFMIPLWFCTNHTYYFLGLSGAVIENVPLILLVFTSSFTNVQGGCADKRPCSVSRVSLPCNILQ
jgi:hypothetical protein